MRILGARKVPLIEIRFCESLGTPTERNKQKFIYYTLASRQMFLMDVKIFIVNNIKTRNVILIIIIRSNYNT